MPREPASNDEFEADSKFPNNTSVYCTSAALSDRLATEVEATAITWQAATLASVASDGH